MIPARGPGSELFYPIVPTLDAPPHPVVPGKSPHVPHDPIPRHVRGEGYEPLQRVFFVPARTGLREYHELERSPALFRAHLVLGDALPSPLRILDDRLLYPVVKDARHQERLTVPLECIHHRGGEESPVEEEERDVDIVEPRFGQQTLHDLILLVEETELFAGNLGPPPLLYALEGGVDLVLGRPPVLLAPPQEPPVQIAVVTRQVMGVYRSRYRRGEHPERFHLLKS